MLTNVKKKYIHVVTVLNVLINQVLLNVPAQMIIVEMHTLDVHETKRNVLKTQTA